MIPNAQLFLFVATCTFRPHFDLSLINLDQKRHSAYFDDIS